jgi:phosphate transport system permease protein
MKLRPFRLLVLCISLLIPAALCAVVLFLMVYSGRAIAFNGLHFITDLTWNFGDLFDDPVTVNGFTVPAGAEYGILAFIVGTLASSAIAIAIAVPLSVGTAIFLAEAVPVIEHHARRVLPWCPPIRPVLAMLVELVAVVPSVVFGLWGIIVLVPLIGHTISPNGSGYGLLACGIVLALMITPIIASTLYDALLQVPKENRESAFALGSTHFEVVTKAMLPMVRSTLVGGVVLALGRALGETMAVLMVSGGGGNMLPHSLFSPISTIASFIVSQLDSAQADMTNMSVRALAELAFVLFLITLAVNATAKLLASGALNVRSHKA